MYFHILCSNTIDCIPPVIQQNAEVANERLYYHGGERDKWLYNFKLTLLFILRHFGKIMLIS